MTEKQINKWLRRQFSPIGWVLLGDFVLMNLLVSLVMAVDMGKQMLWNIATGSFPLDFNMDAIYNNGWGYVASGLVVCAIMLAWKGSGYWRRILCRREQKMRPFALFACLSFCMGAQMLNSLWIGGLEWVMNRFDRSVLTILEGVSGATGSFSMFLYAAIAAPLTEELLFRGFVLDSLRPYGKRFAIFGSAVLFGLFHGNLLQVPYAFLMGLVLGYLAAEYSFVWALVLHVFNNLVLAEGLGRLAEILPVMAADILTVSLLGLFFLISLVILLANRQKIRDYRRSEWIDRRCVKCLFTSPAILILIILLIGMMGSLFWV